MKFQLSTKVVGVEKTGGALKVTVEPAAAGGDKKTIETDIMLVSIGRRPYTDKLGLAEIGVKLDPRGRVITDAHFRTNVEGIWAIGDCREGPMLAHKAEDEAVACAENIAGRAGHVNYDAIPAVVYTAPEVASVGKTEEELKAAGIAYKVGKFPFTANARAKTIAATDGFAKVIADAKTDRVLGVHILGAECRQHDRRSRAGDRVRRRKRRHRAHQPRAPDAERSRPPGRDGRRRLDDADVTPCVHLGGPGISGKISRLGRGGRVAVASCFRAEISSIASVADAQTRRGPQRWSNCAKAPLT